MFSYNIESRASEDSFFRVCRLIESTGEVLNKEKLLIDVDGTMIQIYRTMAGRIKVFNDYEVDAVYVDSDIKLPQLGEL